MDSDLSARIPLRVVEQAAIACAHTWARAIGFGADQVAVEAVREVMDTVPIDGTIVIGEGGATGADALHRRRSDSSTPGISPGRSPCATTRWTSRSIRSRARTCARPARPTPSRCCGVQQGRTAACARSVPWRSWSSGRVRRTRSASTRRSRNQGDRVGCLRRRVEDLVVVVLERSGTKLIRLTSATGARIRLIGDGDLSAGIAAAVVGSGVHAVMGTDGAPEGVLTAAAMRCLNGEIFARRSSTSRSTRKLPRDGDRDFKKVYRSKDLARATTSSSRRPASPTAR